MRTHSTLKRDTLVGRFILFGFVDDTSFVFITKGETQMLKLCIGLERQQAQMRPGKTEVFGDKKCSITHGRKSESKGLTLIRSALWDDGSTGTAVEKRTRNRNHHQLFNYGQP